MDNKRKSEAEKGKQFIAMIEEVMDVLDEFCKGGYYFLIQNEILNQDELENETLELLSTIKSDDLKGTLILAFALLTRLNSMLTVSEGMLAIEKLIESIKQGDER